MTFAGNKDYMLTVAKDGRACFFKVNSVSEITKIASGLIYFMKDQRQLIIEEIKNCRLTFYSVPGLELKVFANPQRIRPRTLASAQLVRNLSHQENKILILDKDGNLFLIYKPGKKWQKLPIFSARK